MRRALAILALAALAACGGGRAEAPGRHGDSLDGVRGFLGAAFGGRSGGGGLCGDRRLTGSMVGAVEGRLAACGIPDAVRITEVNGIPLSQGALVDCPTARAFADWVDRSAEPNVGRRGGGIARIEVAAHYVCRMRNHQPGGPVSEHGKGKAIDISGFTLANGDRITVLDDWGRGRPGRMLRRMHGDACGPFGTVLGPGSDAFHDDHFHFDTARHRGGPYCR